MKIGFIGLGNVGAKLAGSIARNGHELWVRDLNRNLADPFIANGAHWSDSPVAMAKSCDIVITCLPSPAACSAVMEDPDGLLAGLGPGKIWIEMSTTDAKEVARLAVLVANSGAKAAECPVSGGCHRAATGNIAIFAGCHRAATGNIAIFAGCSRDTFEEILPVLTVLGRRVLHTGDIGTASSLKVMTNFLATANLVAVSEALTTCKALGLDLNTTYLAIRISSGNSFVHETEGQVILNGSRDINFTMDLVLKDISLFQDLAHGAGVGLDMSPLLISLFKDAIERFGPRELSPNIIKRLEEANGLDVTAPGFPAEITDEEPEELGYEVVIHKS